MRKWGPETGLVWGHPTKKFKTLKDKGVKYFNLIKKDFCFQASCTEAVPRAALLLPTNIYWNPTTSHSKKDGVSGKMRIPRVWFQHWIEACDVVRKSLQYEKPCLLTPPLGDPLSFPFPSPGKAPESTPFVCSSLPTHPGFLSSSTKGSPGPTLPS